MTSRGVALPQASARRETTLAAATSTMDVPGECTARVLLPNETKPVFKHQMCNAHIVTRLSGSAGCQLVEMFGFKRDIRIGSE